jgi:hypothetical protein
MMAHRQQNPLYTHFDDLCDVMRQYDDVEPGRRLAAWFDCRRE